MGIAVDPASGARAYPVLRSRGLAVSRSVARRIEAERDPARLDAWIARAVSAASIEDVFADE